MLTIDNAYVVGLTGDWHQDLPWSQVVLDTFVEYGVTHVFQLGDFGFSLDNRGRKFLYKINQKLKENNQFLYVTLGNHENYAHFLKNAVQIEDAPGWLTVQDYDRILFAGRGARMMVDGVSFVSLGGANSIDRVHRTEGVDWWREEQVSFVDVLSTASGGHADVMLTHDTPIEVDMFAGAKSGSDWTNTDIAYADLSREKISDAVKKVQPKLLFHGHYHFYADHETVLNEGKDSFTLHSVCLDMNRSRDNMALLMLDSLSFEQVPVSAGVLKVIRSQMYRD